MKLGQILGIVTDDILHGIGFEGWVLNPDPF